ncbi:MAG: LTA synthase family protein [Omnitrophica WOR_2 bacterium]|jgi:phosphoglycerol transferase MdoB-like AlkP superfamily enzyme
MNKIIASFLRQLSFWILFFFISRAIFILYNIRLIAAENISVGETLGAFWHSLPLDLATTCYLLVFPFVLLVLQSIYSPGWLNKINKYYTLIAIILFSLLTCVELGIYPEWKTKLPFKALMYLNHPAEVYNSASTSSFFLLISLFLIETIGGYWIYRKVFAVEISVPVKKWYFFTPVFIAFSLPILVLGARGGWQQIPINQSESYYSNHNILNLASVNSAFNFSISIIENYKNIGKNPYNFYPIDEATKEVKDLYFLPKDTTVMVLKTQRPNIVLLILESWSADLIESIGGEKGITPQFHELEKGGILFTNLYATGPRSEQAMGSIFSGFPAHPISSVTVQPDKFTKLPTITHELIDQGYHTSFYFGGQLRYGNIKGYILYNGFKRVVEHTDFGNNVIRGKLGVHDEFVLSRQLSDLNNEKEPFFSGLFTLSSHSPYDQPMKNVFNWGGNENNYINSAYYTDKCLGNYFREARKQPWYKNTLFIIVADHSHNSYRNWTFTTPVYHKIPLLFYGEVIKDEYRGNKINRFSNQMDLASTLLKQLGLSNSDFKWSRNLFNPYSPEFVYYSFEEGFGWVTKKGHFVYEPKIDHYSEDTFAPQDKDSVRKQGKSFLEVLFNEYMNL